MAMSLNRVQLIGNVTRDPEMREIPGGSMVASFGIATNFTWNDAQGNRQSKVEFHNIVAWRKLAEICSTYLKKGSKVFIEGRLQTREWDGQDGVKRYRTEIIADNMIMLDKKGSESGEMGAGMGAGASAGASYAERPHKAVAKKAEGSGEGAGADEMAVDAVPAGEEINIEDLPF
ncbi:MAG: single-strand binding protein, single-strand DNA-binding protein [Candidatus Peregrinibacteria bacterium GW2011_GWC2_39_14]|nr:MAG: single-strand binding protein, single-strand DNA-binding protein [Candidatus Peregrinibacteria bacterium GW2011_GWC2_39_14]